MARQDRAHQVKPNYTLLFFGFVFGFLLVVINLIQRNVLQAPMQALLISISLVLILYGMYPVPEMRAGFGTLSVVGPAAVGIFIFLFVWKSLLVAETRRYIVLQNIQDPALSSGVFPDGTAITLLDVLSLSTENLMEPLEKLKVAIKKAGTVDSGSMAQKQKEFFESIIEEMKFGAKESQAKNLFDIYEKHPEEVNEKWKKLVEGTAGECANKKEFLTRIKHQPFAVVKIREGGDFRVELVLPEKVLVVNGREYAIPVIANPPLKVTRGIQESIVILVDK